MINTDTLNKVKSLLYDLGVSDSVLFTDFWPEGDKIRAYVDSDVVVNVEPLNVYGLVSLEAAVCSTPVIVSKTNAISKIVPKLDRWIKPKVAIDSDSWTYDGVRARTVGNGAIDYMALRGRERT